MLKLIRHEHNVLLPTAMGGTAPVQHAYRLLTERGEELWPQLDAELTQGSKVYGPTIPFPGGRKRRVTEARIGGWHAREHGLQSADPWRDMDLRLDSFFARFRLQLIPGKLAFAYQSRDGGPWLYAELLGVPAKFDPYSFEDLEDTRVWRNVWPGVNVWLKHAWGDRLGLWLEVLSPDAQHQFAFRVIAEEDGKEILPKGILTATGLVTNPAAIASLVNAGASKVRVLDHGQCKVTEFLAWDRTGKHIASEGYSYKSGERLQSIPVQPASAYPLVLDTDVTEQVGASGDDGYWSGSFFDNNLYTPSIGNYGSVCHIFARWTTVAVDQGATIGPAIVRYTEKTSYGLPVVSLLYMNDVADAAAPANSTEAEGKALTAASVAMTISTWADDGQPHDTPDISEPLQEVVDIPTFASGNDIMLLHRDNGSENYKLVGFYSYDQSAAYAPKLVFAWSAGGGPQTITATGIASAVAYGSATVSPGAVNIAASGIASAVAYGSAAVTTGAVNIAATGIESGAAIGEPSVVQVISAQGIASGAAVGEPALTVGAVDIGATGIESGITFGEAAIGVGPVEIAAQGIPSGTVFGSPAVTTGAVDIAASGIESAVQFGEAQVKQVIATQGIASGAAFGSANVGVGAVGIQASGVESAVAFGEAAVTPGAVDIAAEGIPSTIQFGSASVQTETQFIEATGILSGAAFGNAVVTPEAVAIQASGIESAAAVGEPSVTPGAVAIVAEGIASQEAVGEPAITVGAVEIQASGIESGAAFGEAAVSPGPVNIAGQGIESAEAFGSATVLPGAVDITATGIESTEAVGSAAVTPGSVEILAQGVASGAAFGEAQVVPGPVGIEAQGIAGAAAIGSAEVAPGPVGIQADGIPSAIAVGSAAVVPGPVEIAAQGIESGVAFGQAVVEGAPVVISAQGIPSGAAFGSPAVQPGPVNISAQGIGSAVAFGAPAITCLVTITASGIPSGAAVGSLTVTPGPVNITATGIASGVQFGSARVAHPMPLPLRCLGRIRLRAGDERLLLTTHGRIRLKAVIGVSTTVELTVGQTYPIIEITAVDADGSAIDWTGWDSVVFYLANRAGTIKINGTAAEFVSPRTGGKLKYTAVSADVDTAGVYYGQFKCTDGTSIAYVPSNPNDAIKVVIGARVGS